MAFLCRAERRQAEAIAHIGYCNPSLYPSGFIGNVKL